MQPLPDLLHKGGRVPRLDRQQEPCIGRQKQQTPKATNSPDALIRYKRKNSERDSSAEDARCHLDMQPLHDVLHEVVRVPRVGLRRRHEVVALHVDEVQDVQRAAAAGRCARAQHEGVDRAHRPVSTLERARASLLPAAQQVLVSF